MITNVIKKFLLKRKIKYIKKLVTVVGHQHSFSRNSFVELSDGSVKDDIVISSNVMMYGSLASQDHGRIFLGEYSKIGYNTIIGSVKEVSIGEYTAIADWVVIMDNNNHPIHPDDRLTMRKTPHGSEYRKWKYSDSQSIRIGRNVWIGTHSRINKGVEIGDNSIVGANSVVTKSVPENSIVAGNPARVVKGDIDKARRVFLES